MLTSRGTHKPHIKVFALATNSQREGESSATVFHMKRVEKYFLHFTNFLQNQMSYEHVPSPT